MKNSLSIKLQNLPVSPGVYRFLDKNGKVIYIGKAKNLRIRVKSYFQSRPLGPRLEKMVSYIKDLDVISTDSEVESLILEMNLIRELKPRYNVLLKDDKSFPYIVITNELFPRVFPTRKRINNGSKYFGPYTDVSSMKYSLKMLRDIFMIRTCNYNITNRAIENKKYKLCLEYHIKKCEGPCEGLVSEEHYREMISEVEKLLNGKSSSLINELEKKMELAAGKEQFEEAVLLRNKINSLKIYSSKQKIISDDIIDRDVFGFEREGNDACIVILNVREGKVIGKRHFYLMNTEDKTDEEILENVLFGYYSQNDFFPDEIHLQCGLPDNNTFQKWLNSRTPKNPELVFPKRGGKVQLVNMVRANARFMLGEMKLQKLKHEFIPNSIAALQRELNLPSLPRRIECYDISNFQGTDTVASMIVFQDGRARKSEYRKFRLHNVLNETGKPDDFLSMQEVISRRFRRLIESAEKFHKKGDKLSDDESFSSPPDLIIVDGGKGQLSSAVKVLKSFGLVNQSIIGLAKRLEEVFLPGHSDAQSIPKTSAGLKLLQRVRNEAHRFALTYHRLLRDNRTLQSELEEIKGIGKKTARKLLTKFGSVDNLRLKLQKDYSEIQKLCGTKTAQKLNAFFKSS